MININSMQPDDTNTMFQLAYELVNQTNSNIFLTGKAGTGKTTFLKHIKLKCSKHMAVVAPTGVAAINAGGVTIHSFFQLPISPFIPSVASATNNSNEEVITTYNLLSRLRITSEKKALLQELELLIIDEISMVRCDTIDAIDTVLRHVRQKPKELFGGVQLLFIGDMLQLPPVINDQSWQVLSGFYQSPYFFESIVLKANPPLHIEFNKIYRQSDQAFIDLLNRVRHNEMDQASLEVLNSRYQPSFHPPKGEDYIVLTTHNLKAKEINQKELDLLTAPQFSYAAEISGDFFEKSYPADEMLHLKIGAQVMFIKNDSADKGKRYFNGKLGIIKSLEKDKIVVSISNTSDDIDVQQETWENIRYTLNKQTRQIDEEVLGSFKQYPLRLAWAITIHKSQGLTFEKAIIDAGESFSPGQVYVALSRCTTLQGLVLQSRIRTSGLMNDKRIINFSKQLSSLQQLQNALQNGKGQYHLKLLLSLFDFSNSLEQAATLHNYLLALPNSFNETSVNASADIKNQLTNLQSIAIKFQLQLERLFTQGDTGMLSDRIAKASNHFNTAIKPLIDSIIHTPIITDSKLHAKEVNDIVKEIIGQLSFKKFLWEDAERLITTETFLQRKNSFKTPSASVNVYAGAAQKAADSPHPVLHQQLRKVREEICSKNNLPVYIVAGSVTIDEMARYLPQTLEELEHISGFGEVKIGRYGNLFLEVILAYAKMHNLTSLIHEKSAKKERRKIDNSKPVKVNTKAESFRLFKEGKTVEDIAKERGFAIQTIQGHLAEFVQRGDINIEELVSHEKILVIEPAITGSESITVAKEKLGNEFSFGEIRLVIAWQAFKKTTAPE